MVPLGPGVPLDLPTETTNVLCAAVGLRACGPVVGVVRR